MPYKNPEDKKAWRQSPKGRESQRRSRAKYYSNPENAQKARDRERRRSEEKKAIKEKYYEEHREEIELEKKQKRKAYYAQYYQDNKEKISQQHKEWRDKNIEKIAQQRKAIYDKNKDNPEFRAKRILRGAKYRANNIELLREKDRIRIAKNRDSINTKKRNNRSKYRKTYGCEKDVIILYIVNNPAYAYFDYQRVGYGIPDFYLVNNFESKWVEFKHHPNCELHFDMFEPTQIPMIRMLLMNGDDVSVVVGNKFEYFEYKTDYLARILL